MAIKLAMEEKSNHLHVKCNGEFEAVAFLDACKEALAFACEKKIAAVLIDVRNLTGDVFTTMERYEFGKAFAEYQIRLPIVICAAVLGKEPLIDPDRFAETVALNRGALGKVFTNIEEATNWLERWNQERMDN